MTIVESVLGGVSAAIAPYYNILWMWTTDPDALNPSKFALLTSMGYGFWAAGWGLATYAVLQAKAAADHRRHAKILAIVYVFWWVLWYPTLTDGTWKYYALSTSKYTRREGIDRFAAYVYYCGY